MLDERVHSSIHPATSHTHTLVLSHKAAPQSEGYTPVDRLRTMSRGARDSGGGRGGHLNGRSSGEEERESMSAHTPYIGRAHIIGQSVQSWSLSYYHHSTSHLPHHNTSIASYTVSVDKSTIYIYTFWKAEIFL